MTAIYLVGAMGSGKSTLMAAIIDLLGLATGDWIKVYPSATRSEFRGELLEDIITGECRGLYLGRNRPEFPGTDAIGLASHAEALSWARTAPELPDLILGEGQRLGTSGFLGALAERTELTVGHCVAPQEVLDERVGQRWAGQEKPSGRSEGFRKSTKTRAENAVAGARDAGFDVVEIDTSWHGPETWAEIILQTTSLL